MTTLLPSAFVAGVLMFLAPCTLPIVPGYLLFIAGSGEGEIRRKAVLLNAVAFVAGFSLVFMLLGLFAATIGNLLGPWRDTIARGAGVVLVFFGLTMLGVLRLPLLGGQWSVRVPSALMVGRWQSSLFIGSLFAIGWSPCVGPILGSVLLLASSTATALEGALLLGVFSMGLGLPFILTALFIDRAQRFAQRAGVHLKTLSWIAGVLLIVVGVLITFGMLGVAVSWCYHVFELLGYQWLYNYL